MPDRVPSSVEHRPRRRTSVLSVGTATVLEPPLEFTVLPQALRVLVPSSPPQHPPGALQVLRWRSIRSLWVLARATPTARSVRGAEPDAAQ
jgi:hypothetical protein